MLRTSTKTATTLIANENVGIGRSGAVVRKLSAGAAMLVGFSEKKQPANRWEIPSSLAIAWKRSRDEGGSRSFARRRLKMVTRTIFVRRLGDRDRLEPAHHGMATRESLGFPKLTRIQVASSGQERNNISKGSMRKTVTLPSSLRRLDGFS